MEILATPALPRGLFTPLTHCIIVALRWTLIQLTGFERLWRSQKLPDEDLQALEAAIMRDPAGPPVMRGSGGLRKIRFAPPSYARGKSGAMRVGYVQFPDFARIYLVTLFLKKNQENLSGADRRAISDALSLLADKLRQGREP